MNTRQRMPVSHKHTDACVCGFVLCVYIRKEDAMIPTRGLKQSGPGQMQNAADQS
jgi:hypothetical protein